jgi:hypothetical protein
MLGRTAPLRGAVHASSTPETLQLPKGHPRRVWALCARKRLLQMWVQGCASGRDERRFLPGMPTSNASRKGSLVMQESPEDLDTPEEDPSGPTLLPLTACPRRRPDAFTQSDVAQIRRCARKRRSSGNPGGSHRGGWGNFDETFAENIWLSRDRAV